MTVKRAILQVGHPGSLESIVTMFQAVGIECLVCGEKLRDHLKNLGCDTVISAANMAKTWGTRLRFDLAEAKPKDLDAPGILYVDTKAHRNGPKVWDRHPHLQDRTLYYRINGARPCIVPGKGDEIDPPCPVLTPDPWYDSRMPVNREGKGVLPKSTLDKSYSRWPPFARWDDHQVLPRVSIPDDCDSPVCLVHNLSGWGYGDVGTLLQDTTGLRCYGGWGSPDGLRAYSEVPETMASASCMVHLKSQDCPGYSLYEALASACPIVCSRMLIAWCQMHDLFTEGETCLCFDRAVGVNVGEPAEPIDVAECASEAAEKVALLNDPVLNRKIGEAGRKRIRGLMWSPSKSEDVDSLQEFLERVF